MTGHKFIDEEVIKALECCRDFGDCSLCPYDGAVFDEEPDCAEKLHTDALDLINRQKAEIKGLSVELDLAKAFYKEKESEFSLLNYKYNKTLNQLNDYQSITRAEAIKGFAEKLKNNLDISACGYSSEEVTNCVIDTIDNLIEEMSNMHEG